MFYNRAGSHSHHIADDFSREYDTFNPTPLCEIDFIETDDELLGLLSNAQRLIGLLEGSSRHIENIKNFTSLMYIKEAAASCGIDDELRFTYLDLFIEPKYKQERLIPIQNYRKALEYGIEELSRIHLANKVIYATHKILMDHKRGTETIGAERTGKIIFGNYYRSGGPPKYNPPAPEDITLCMNDIQRYIKRVDNIDILIKTALLHYQLEAIHPFQSGNGKIGRILIALYLFKKKVLGHTLLPISEFLAANKVEYFDRIKAVHDFGKYEQWIKFFLTALAATADTALQRLEKALQLREKNITTIKTSNKDVKYLLDACQYIEKHVFLDTTSLAEAIGVSYNTSARVVKELVDLNILKLLKNQARNRVYFYAELLDVMEIDFQGI